MPVLEYLGQTPRTFILPIPYLSHSERTGEITFNPTADVDETTADFLLKECGDAFREVTKETVQEALTEIWTPTKQTTVTAVEKAIGKRFSGKAGKWNAKAYIRRHGLEALVGMKALKISGQLVHWELIPLTDQAVAESSAGEHAPVAVEAGQEDLDANEHTD